MIHYEAQNKWPAEKCFCRPVLLGNETKSYTVMGSVTAGIKMLEAC